MSFAQALKNEDFKVLVDRLTAYVAWCIRGVSIKKREGLEPIDLVAEVLRKAADGTRIWNPNKVDLRGFLFGCLRSDIDNYLRKVKEVGLTDPLEDFLENHPCESPEERADAIEKLKREGSDQCEIDLFECWADGIIKPAEIAEELQISVDNVYLTTRSLKRRLSKITMQ